MASTSQAHPAFPPRSTYTASGKLPDRTTLNNPAPFGSSALSRRPDQQTQQYSQQPPQPPQHGQQQGGAGRQHQQQQQSSAEKEPNPLNELSEEQREEINEAVRQTLHYLYPSSGPSALPLPNHTTTLLTLPLLLRHSSPSST
jgi:hypothetical protein